MHFNGGINLITWFFLYMKVLEDSFNQSVIVWQMPVSIRICSICAVALQHWLQQLHTSFIPVTLPKSTAMMVSETVVWNTPKEKFKRVQFCGPWLPRNRSSIPCSTSNQLFMQKCFHIQQHSCYLRHAHMSNIILLQKTYMSNFLSCIQVMCQGKFALLTVFFWYGLQQL